jgi:hypothetical protein
MCLDPSYSAKIDPQLWAANLSKNNLVLPNFLLSNLTAIIGGSLFQAAKFTKSFAKSARAAAFSLCRSSLVSMAAMDKK